MDDIKEIRPTIFGSVPRIFEKAHTKILTEAQKGSPLKKKILEWAKTVGRETSQRQKADKPVPTLLRMQYTLADKLVFRKIRDVFGSRIKYFISSAAPISIEIIEFFHSAGMLILEGYGQTEVSCFCTLNLPDDYRLGSVGKALPGVELRINEEKEILVRGPIVFKGYLNQPELNQETLTKDGWIHTGDLGYLDEDGFLYVTGRKKEIIITSGGKNITPANIENLLKNHPLIEQALVHGDKRKYLTALLGLDMEQVREWAKENGINSDTVEQLRQQRELRPAIQEWVDRVNSQLARYETIKRFAILPRLLEVEKHELTPTMKIRRQVVEEHFKDLLDGLYKEP